MTSYEHPLNCSTSWFDLAWASIIYYKTSQDAADGHPSAFFLSNTEKTINYLSLENLIFVSLFGNANHFTDFNFTIYFINLTNETSNWKRFRRKQTLLLPMK